jgi:hypothetical protein
VVLVPCGSLELVDEPGRYCRIFVDAEVEALSPENLLRCVFRYQ